jgi:hypothetical protein
VRPIAFGHRCSLNPAQLGGTGTVELIDRTVKRCGGFTGAFFESGAQFRKLNITIADIEASGIKISTNVLAVAARSGFADPQTGQFAR